MQSKSYQKTLKVQDFFSQSEKTKICTCTEVVVVVVTAVIITFLHVKSPQSVCLSELPHFSQTMSYPGETVNLLLCARPGQLISQLLPMKKNNGTVSVGYRRNPTTFCWCYDTEEAQTVFCHCHIREGNDNRMTHGNMGWKRNTGETMEGHEGVEEQRRMT